MDKMILSDKTILKSVKEGKIEIKPFQREHLSSSSYDVTLDEKGLIVKDENGLIDLKKPQKTEEIQINEGGFALLPNKGYLLSTREFINLPPDLCAIINGRSSLARNFIEIHSTGGFEGTLTLEVSNKNNCAVEIYPNMRIAQLVFFELDKEAEKPYQGKYKKQKGVTESKIFQEFS